MRNGLKDKIKDYEILEDSILDDIIVISFNENKPIDIQNILNLQEIKENKDYILISWLLTLWRRRHALAELAQCNAPFVVVQRVVCNAFTGRLGFGRIRTRRKCK